MGKHLVQLLMFIVALLSSVGALLFLSTHDYVGFGLCVAIVLVNILGMVTIKENDNG